MSHLSQIEVIDAPSLERHIVRLKDLHMLSIQANSIGSIMICCKSSIPENYIDITESQILSKVQYPELYAIVGDEFGNESNEPVITEEEYKLPYMTANDQPEPLHAYASSTQNAFFSPHKAFDGDIGKEIGGQLATSWASSIGTDVTPWLALDFGETYAVHKECWYASRSHPNVMSTPRTLVLSVKNLDGSYKEIFRQSFTNQLPWNTYTVFPISGQHIATGIRLDFPDGPVDTSYYSIGVGDFGVALLKVTTTSPEDFTIPGAGVLNEWYTYAMRIK